MSLHIRPAVSSDIDRVLDAVTVCIAVAVLLGQAGPGHSYAHGRKLRVAQCAGERVVTAQFDVDGGLILYRRDALDVVLLDSASAPLPLHAREVHVAAGIHDRRVVEVDVAVGRCAVKLPLAHSQQQLGDVGRLQAVRRLDGGFWLALAALGAGDVQVICRAHAFLRATKNRPEAVCTLNRP
ncbi:hypothetical protein D3C80_505050 [compost metagenome]